MTEKDKKKKAAMIAVAYYVQQLADVEHHVQTKNGWSEMGKAQNMENRIMVQRRGRIPMGA